MVASTEYRSSVQQYPEQSLGRLDLTDRERRRLVAVAGQPGMRVNTAIHRANRLATVAQTLPFTCFLLSVRMPRAFDRYWAANPTESLQLPVECERFALFLEGELERGQIDDPYLGEILRFERACTKLRFYTGAELESMGWCESGLPALIRVVRFSHNPVALLDALSESQLPMNVETGEFFLAIDCRSGEVEFRLLDAAGVAALQEWSADVEAATGALEGRTPVAQIK